MDKRTIIDCTPCLPTERDSIFEFYQLITSTVERDIGSRFNEESEDFQKNNEASFTGLIVEEVVDGS